MFLLLSLLGCGLFTSAAGDWDGECSASGYSLGLEMEIKDSGGKLTGDATISVSGMSLGGTLKGDRDGSEVTIKMTWPTGDDPLVLEFEGELDGDDLEGELDMSGYNVDCSFER